MDRDEIERAAREELHFDEQWFVDGMLSPDFFAQQIQKYRTVQRLYQAQDAVADDLERRQATTEADLSWASREHHRYAAFQTLLKTHEQFTAEELARYIRLCELDEEKTMARSALINLLLWPGLGEKQRQNLASHPAFANEVIQKIIWRQQKQLELAADEISAELFAEIMQRHDAVVERELVQSKGLTRPQLEAMAEHGCNRALRNLAKVRLKRATLSN